jgi:hypothetical protein
LQRGIPGVRTEVEAYIGPGNAPVRGDVASLKAA